MKPYDLIGQQFGSLKVQERVPSGKKVKWRCSCDCGNDDYFVTTSSLISGKTFRCNICGKKASGKAKRKSYIGKKYGLLTIVDEIYNYNDTHKKVFVCNCDCGKNNIIKESTYKFSNDSSCGCNLRNIRQRDFGIDITGQYFGRLYVKEVLWKYSPIKVLCQCKCGKEVVLNKRDVTSLHTQSCGCLQKEMVAKGQYVDYSGYISDSGIKIIQPYKQNEKRTMDLGM